MQCKKIILPPPPPPQTEQFEQLLGSLQQNYLFLDTEIRKIQEARVAEDSLEFDTILFSIKPQDISRMSVYSSWRSCMSPDGCNHHYVKQDIGRGTIIAYAINSKKPHEHLARILIKPYRNDKNRSEVIYGIEKIYGPHIDDFHNIVKRFSALNFDMEVSNGIYQANDELYNDSIPENILKLDAKEYFKYSGIPFKEIYKELYVDDLHIDSNNIDYSNVHVNYECVLSKYEVDVKKLPIAKDLKAETCTFQDLINLSKYKSLQFIDCDLKKQNFSLSNEDSTIHISNCQMPQIFDAKNYKEVIFENLDLRNTKLINFENVKKISFNKCQLNEILDVGNCEKLKIKKCDLENFEIKGLHNVKEFTLKNCTNVSGEFDLSNCKDLLIEETDLKNVMLKNAQIVQNLSLSNLVLDESINLASCKSLKLDECDCRQLKPESFKYLQEIDMNNCKLPERLQVDACEILQVNNRDTQHIIFENTQNVQKLKLWTVILTNETSFENCKDAELRWITIKSETPEFLKNVKYLTLMDVTGLKDISLPLCENLKLYGSNFETTLFKDLNNLKKVETRGCLLPKNFEAPNLKMLELGTGKISDYWKNIIRSTPKVELSGQTLNGVQNFEKVKSLRLLSLKGKSLFLRSNQNAQIDIAHADLTNNATFENIGTLEMYSSSFNNEKLTCRNIDKLSARINEVNQLELENIQSASFKFSDFDNLEATKFKNVNECTFEDTKFSSFEMDVNGIKQLKIIDCRANNLTLKRLSTVDKILIEGFNSFKHIDFDGCKNVELNNCDFDTQQPKNLGKCKNVKLYRCDMNYSLDFNGCENLEIDYCYYLRSGELNNLGSVKNIIFRKLSQFPQKIDVAGCEKLIIDECYDFKNVKIKGIEKVKHLSLSEVVLPKKLNVSGCEILHISRCRDYDECEIIGLENVKEVSGAQWLLDRHKEAISKKEKREHLLVETQKVSKDMIQLLGPIKKLFCLGELSSCIPQETMALKALLKAAQKKELASSPSLKKGNPYKKGITQRK